MTAVYKEFIPEEGITVAATGPEYKRFQGTNFPVSCLAFDAAADEVVYFKRRLLNYGSGNFTFEVSWYADTASSGDVVWGVSVALMTADADAQDEETKALATETTVTDSHLGTVAQRPMKAIVVVTNLDSAASGDELYVRVRRIGSNGSDTMLGDALLTLLVMTYSDV